MNTTHIMDNKPPGISDKLSKQNQTAKQERSSEMNSNDNEETSKGRHKGRKEDNWKNTSAMKNAMPTYTCPHCGKTLKSKWYLQKHVKNVHEKTSRLKCKFEGCHQTFSIPITLKNHVRYIHEKAERQMHACFICHKSVVSRAHLARHTRSVHDQSADFKCEYDGCDKKYRSNFALQSHRLAKHLGTTYTCEICDKKFGYKGGLDRHTNEVHGPSVVFQCKFKGCDKTFNVSDSLRCHVMAKHTQTRYPCTICEKSFSLKRNLQTHTKTHERTKNLKCECEGCGKIYQVQNSLLNHIKRKHIMIAPLDCGQSSKDKTNQLGESSKTDSGNECNTRKSLKFPASMERINQTKPAEDLVHITFNVGEIRLGKLRKAFYAKALQACQDDHFGGGASLCFEDIIRVNGKPTLRLKSSEHVPFFLRILEGMAEQLTQGNPQTK